MILWLKTFCGIRWTVMFRSNEVKAGLFGGFIAPKWAHWQDEGTAIHINPSSLRGVGSARRRPF